MATRSLLETAQQHEKKGSLAKAAEAYSQHLAGNPNDVRALLRYGELQERLGRLEPAADTFHRVAVIHSRDSVESKATAALRRALKLAPKHFESAELLAEVFHKAGKKRDAIEVLRAAVRTAISAGDQAARLKLLLATAQVDQSPSTMLELAQSFAEGGQTIEATKILREAVQQLRSPGKALDRMEVLEQLQKLSPDDREVAFDGAATALSLGDPRRALAILRVVLDLIPEDVDVISMVGTVLDAMGEDARALLVHREAARKFTAVRRDEEARRSWIAVLQFSPADPEALEAIGAEQAPTPPPPPPKAVPLLDLDAAEIEGALSFLAERSPPPRQSSITDLEFEVSLEDLETDLVIQQDPTAH